MEGIYTQTTQLLTQPEEYLRPSKRLEEAWKEQTQAMYNFLKKEEDRHELPAIPGALPRLQTDGLDIEQVWQLVELQNKALLAAPEDLDGLDHTNLCFMVARLSSLAKHDKLSRANELLTEDEGIGGSPQESDDMDDDDDDDNDMKEDEEEMDNAKEVSDEDMSGDDEDLFEKPDDLKDTGLNDVFGDDSDDEEDNFDDFIAKEGVESDDDDEDEVDKKKKQGGEANIEDSEARQEKKKKEGKKFGKTEIDTTFFSLRESEWVADQDAIGENYSGDDEDIDLMADISDSSEEEVRHSSGPVIVMVMVRSIAFIMTLSLYGGEMWQWAGDGNGDRQEYCLYIHSLSSATHWSVVYCYSFLRSLSSFHIVSSFWCWMAYESQW
ncbi:hypothetical protein E2C01_020973 [Portunus trituberculatus]|uniref:Uncharacterized protein n=1 Tax=Portunus trituberculatus TaxID=210409 RepID=A0A5B7E305_PORTR|nr:hypothetical protein [Portunus trituberculatus]